MFKSSLLPPTTQIVSVGQATEVLVIGDYARCQPVQYHAVPGVVMVALVR